MVAASPLIAAPAREAVVRHLVISVETREPLQFVDLTTAIATSAQALGLRDGVVTVTTRHTTTGILVNEHEPLLLQDLKEMFERLVPASVACAHDDFTRRVVNIGPGERINGHAHCRAALLRTSETLPISGGTLTLGAWQRVFLVDFDGGQRRRVSLTFVGEAIANPSDAGLLRFTRTT